MTCCQCWLRTVCELILRNPGISAAVVDTAKSRFLLQKRDDRIRAYRRRNERLSSSCVQEVDSFGGDIVMVWAVISNDRKTDLVHVPGNLTSLRYRDEILQPHIMHVIDRQPLPEHRRKTNVHSGAYMHVFCHHVSAVESETCR
jgi:hypothetical protein